MMRALKKYSTPEWFRNAKFGIWAHWGHNEKQVK